MLLRIFPVAVIVVTLLCTVTVGFNELVRQVPQKLSSQQKAEKLLAKTLKSPDFLPVLNAEEFSTLVASPDRKFGVFAFFTSTSSGCRPCRILSSQYLLAARGYRTQHPENTNVFIIRVERETAYKAFQEANIQNMPVVAYFAPFRPGDTTLNYTSHDYSRYNAWTAFGIGQFIYSEAGVEIHDLPKPLLSEIESDESAILGWLYAIIGIGILIIAWFVHRQYPGLWRHHLFQFGACVVVWFLMISGFTYNQINRPPLIGMDPQTRAMRLFHPSSHSQLALEGYLMGGMEISFPLLLLIVNEVLPRMLRIGQTHHLTLGVTGGAMVFYLFLFIRLQYYHKNGSYLR